MITSLVIASPEGAKQSHKRLRLQRRSDPRNDILLYGIATLRSQRLFKSHYFWKELNI
jgi:hypothetical protein